MRNGGGAKKGGARTGVLRRLCGDRAGNTLAIMAAALIPIMALAGSAVDTARLYVVKVRLQQACDAGVLAGRKTMDASGSATLDGNATIQAKAFFASNFASGYMGTPAFTASTTPYPFVPVKTADGQVAGTASVAVPLTLMRIFGKQRQTLTVTCQARYDVADSDVMFVLDTTGSMACGTSDPDTCGQPTVQYTRPDGTTGYKVQEKSNSRISALRAAVLSFYDTVAATASPGTNVRYGFVPYTSTVNAGYAVTSVSPGYMVSRWTYDTRQVINDQNLGYPQYYGTTYGTSQSQCAANNNVRVPSTLYKYQTDGTARYYLTSWASANGGTCVTQYQIVTPLWRYAYQPLDVSQYVLGNAVTDPSKVTGVTSKWQGCLEERDTIAASSFDPNNLPPDLDPDLTPTSDSTRWRPLWPDVLYFRTATQVDDNGASSTPYTTNPYGDSSANWWFGNPNAWPVQGGYILCGKPVQRLTTMARSDVSNYVNAPDFVPWGGTYHDTGMIWGTRMLSPGGIFGADTAAWPGHAPPNRYIVFMTDGHMNTNPMVYGMWGWENFDQRTTGGNFTASNDYHNARFLAECQAAKNRNIKVYVVSVVATLDSNLTACASPNAAHFANDAASLTAAFQSIARQVATLRISQ